MREISYRELMSAITLFKPTSLRAIIRSRQVTPFLVANRNISRLLFAGGRFLAVMALSEGRSIPRAMPICFHLWSTLGIVTSSRYSAQAVDSREGGGGRERTREGGRKRGRGREGGEK